MQPYYSLVLSALLLINIGAWPSRASAAEVLPTGTPLNVRTTQELDTSVQPGMRLTAIVDDPVSAGGRIVIPRGAMATLEVVRVEESSNIKGRDRITLKVHSLHVGGRVYPVATNYVELKGRSEGKRAARKIAGGAGVGAMVGGIFGGGTGAAIGAAAGGATGGIVTGSGKQHLRVPAETPLQFQLQGALRIP